MEVECIGNTQIIHMEEPEKLSKQLYLEHQMLGQQVICPSDPAYYIVDCWILNLSMIRVQWMILQKHILNLIELFKRWIHQLRITKQKSLSFFFLSIWLWKPALIGSKIEKRSGKKSWHFGNHGIGELMSWKDHSC